MCNLKYSVSKKIPVLFYNRYNYDYHFIIKEIAEELKKQIACLGEKTKKYLTFTVPIEKQATRIDKSGNEINIYLYLTCNKLLIGQGLWPAHNQILSIIYLKEFIALNVNMDTARKNVKLVELHTKCVTVFLNTQILKMIQ